MARSLAVALDEAVRVNAWERDQEAWNLPRPPEEPARRHTDEHDAGESNPEGQGTEPAAMASGSTE